MKLRLLLIKKPFARVDVCSTMSGGHSGVKKYSEESCSHILYLITEISRYPLLTIWYQNTTSSNNLMGYLIESITYFEKQFIKIIYFWWGPEGIRIFIFKTDKSSFHLLAQPWSCCTKSVSTLGVPSGRIRYNLFTHGTTVEHHMELLLHLWNQIQW